MALTALLVWMVWILAQAPPAAAHAFLIQSTPAAGQRYAKSPVRLSLLFTQAVLPPRSDRVTLVTAQGRAIRIDPLARIDRGTLLTAKTPRLAPGIYVIKWQVVSAIDGHYTAGSLAFAVGNVAGALPVAHTTSPPDWPLALDGWVLLVALALCVGSVANRLWVWRPGPGGPPWRPKETPTLPWLMAVVASLARIVVLAWSAAGSAPLQALVRPGVWLAVVQTPSGQWSVLGLAFLAYAWMVRRRPVTVIVFASLVLSGLSLAMTSHPANSPYGWARVAIAMHVALALIWTGMLMQLTVEMGSVIRESRNPGPILKAALDRYSSVALVLVVGTASSGAVAALAEIRSLGDLTQTLYGQLLLAKGLFAGGALLLAWLARRALRVSRSFDFDRLRRYVRPEAVSLIAILGASALLANVAPPAPRSASPSALSLLGPPPVGAESLTLAGQTGWLEVFLTAAPKTLTLRVISPESTSPRGARLLASDGPGGLYLSGPGIPKGPLLLVLRSCGAGCFTAPFTWPRGTVHVSVAAAVPGWSGGRLVFAVSWPPGPRASAIWRQALRRMGRQRRVVEHETVVTGPGAIARAVYDLTGAQWLASLPYSGAVQDVRLIGAKRSVRQVIVYLPASLIWAHVWLADNGTFLREVIIDHGHKIIHTFGY